MFYLGGDGSIFYAKQMKFDAYEDPLSSEDSFWSGDVSYPLRNNIGIQETGDASGKIDELG